VGGVILSIASQRRKGIFSPVILGRHQKSWQISHFEGFEGFRVVNHSSEQALDHLEIPRRETSSSVWLVDTVVAVSIVPCSRVFHDFWRPRSSEYGSNRLVRLICCSPPRHSCGPPVAQIKRSVEQEAGGG
jgi:hypothetical protein